MHKNCNLLLITHTDLDGEGCAALIKLAFNGVHIERCDYDTVDEVVLKHLEEGWYDTILITDISVKPETAAKLDAFKGEVFLLDHHATAEHLSKYSWATIQLNRTHDSTAMTCGTELLLEFLQKHDLIHHNVDDFVEYVRLYDTWEWSKRNIIEARNLNLVYGDMEKDVFSDMIVHNIIHTGKFEFTKQMLSTISSIDLDIHNTKTKATQNAKVHNIDGYDVCVYNCEKYVSEVGNHLAKSVECDFVAIIVKDSVSLRGIGKHDLGQYAKKYGGGGHFDAAGFSLAATKKYSELVE